MLRKIVEEEAECVRDYCGKEVSIYKQLFINHFICNQGSSFHSNLFVVRLNLVKLLVFHWFLPIKIALSCGSI